MRALNQQTYFLIQPEGGESEMGLALNRYIGNSIMPAFIKYSKFYAEADNYSPLLEATLHTAYRLSKGKMLTNVQRQTVSDFLVSLTNEIHPIMLLKLLRQLTVDLANLNEYSNVALRVSSF
jgi:ryanodine receptor 2